MAGIDKTYGTPEQSIALLRWLKKHRPKFVRNHYGLYFMDDDGSEVVEVCILNTRVSVDKWLARYCPFRFVLERIIDVYGSLHVASIQAKRRLENLAERLT